LFSINNKLKIFLLSLPAFGCGERTLKNNKPSLPLSLLVMVSEMFSCDCFWWNSVPESYPSEPEPFSLPAPLPQWPQGVCFFVYL